MGKFDTISHPPFLRSERFELYARIYANDTGTYSLMSPRSYCKEPFIQSTSRMAFRRVCMLFLVSLQLVLFIRNLDFVRPLSHGCCSCNVNIQSPASLGSKMATTTFLVNTKRSFDKQLRYSIKQSKRRTLYYANSTASFHVLIALRFDIEENPGPRVPSPKCSLCNKTVQSNQQHCVCEFCRSVSHSACLDLSFKHSTRSLIHTCDLCLHRALPFANYAKDLDVSSCDSNESFEQDRLDDMGNDKHVAALENKTNLLKFLHLNTQSLVSTFNEFYITLAKYPFDVVALSETWLSQNKMLLDYVLTRLAARRLRRRAGPPSYSAFITITKGKSNSVQSRAITSLA